MKELQSAILLYVVHTNKTRSQITIGDDAVSSETPPMTGRNNDYFTLTSAKLFTRKVFQTYETLWVIFQKETK